MAETSFKGWIFSLLEPSFLLGSAVYHFGTVLVRRVLLHGELLAPILRISQLRDEAFSKFWIGFSTARAADDQVEPVGSSALIPPLLAKANGTVLDIGPGTGTQTSLFTNPGLRKMYGAEPCVGLHTELRDKIASCGLSSKYQILPCGAEPHSLLPGLHGAGFSSTEMHAGIFDTIVCVRVLCSVPSQRQTVRGLYDLLKPGGKMLVAEHVVNPWTTSKGSITARLMQLLYTVLGWSFFMGDCHMNRDTERALMQAAEEDGGWAKIDIDRSLGWTPLPYISGTLVKKA